MVTIKEYASENNISYEAVRQQVRRYAKELDGHIQKVGKTRFLDDFAVDFLNDKRSKNPVIVLEQDKNEQIERLENENKALLLKVAELQEMLLQEKDNVKVLQMEKIELLESKNTKKRWKLFSR